MLGPADLRIRQRLRAARPNQRRLAAALGRSQSWVSKYVRGGNVIADADDVAAIAAFLGTTVAALLDNGQAGEWRTAARRRAEEVAELWLAATPAVRRKVRDLLELDVARRRSRARGRGED